MGPKVQKQKDDLKKALQRLKEALEQEKNEIIRDSAIQRFEFTIEIAWKLMKSILEEEHEIVVASPKTSIREAFKVGIIEHDDFWLEMLKMRNDTVHSYNEDVAKSIYKKLPKSHKIISLFLSSLDT